MELKRTWYIFISLIITFFAASFILVLYSGVGIAVSVIWSIMNLLNVEYPNLIPYNTAITSPYIFFSNVLGSLAFAILTAFIAAGFFNFIQNVNFKYKRTIRKIKKMKHHVIIVYNKTIHDNFANSIIQELENKSMPVVIIVEDEKDFKHLYKSSKLVLIGNTNSTELLKLAGVSSAKAIILCNKDPIDNILVSITTRALNKRITIISRIKDEDNLGKLTRAGVNNFILPELSAGLELGNIINDKMHSA
jgi:vacuolar-type H+-ATPase subunit F/Vma7